MLTRTLPMLTRALRLDARQVRSHLFRLLFLGFTFLMLTQAHMLDSRFGAPGLQFFEQITILNLLYITMAGISFFATGITEEKEEDTLGLLKMAGINPLVILLGKSTSRLISAALLLIIQIPFVLLAITLGGVTQRQIIDSYCALLAYMILLANMGLFCSVVARRSRTSCGMMLLLLFLFLVGPYIGSGMCDAWKQASDSAPTPIADTLLIVCGWLKEASAWNRVFAVMRTGFNASLISVQLVSNLVAALVFFGLAWLLFERCTRDLAASTAPARGLIPTRVSRFSGLRCGRTWSNALAWKDFFFLTGGKTLMVLKFLLYGAAAAGFAHLVRTGGSQFGRNEWSIMLMIGAALLVMVETSLYAGRLFHEEMKWKTLSTLMMLPVPTWRLIMSKLTGCGLALTPALAYFFVGLALHPSNLGDFYDSLWKHDAAGARSLFGFLLCLLVFQHLTALLSLFVKWGALPLAFVIMLVALMAYQMLSMMIIFGLLGSGGGTEAMFKSLLYATYAILAALIVAMQFAIVSRLKAVAAQ